MSIMLQTIHALSFTNHSYRKLHVKPCRNRYQPQIIFEQDAYWIPLDTIHVSFMLPLDSVNPYQANTTVKSTNNL